MSTSLFLCRTSAQADLLRRQAIQEGGWLGVQVTTPLGLALTAYAPPLSGSAVAKAEAVEAKRVVNHGDAATALLNRLGDRPGLSARLEERVSQVRLHLRYGGTPLSARTDSEKGVLSLAETIWRTHATERAIVALIDRCRARSAAESPGPTLALNWGRVEAVGWVDGVDRDGNGPFIAWERALLRALRATHRTPGTRSFAWQTIPTERVPDVVSEARVATVAALGAGGAGVVAVVPDAATARRLAAAGTRNECAFAVSSRPAIASHALAETYRAAVPWFAGGDDPIIQAAALDRVLNGPRMGHRLPASVATACEKAIANLPPGPYPPRTPTHLSAANLREAIRAARIASAPLSAWLARLQTLSTTPPVREERDVRRVCILLAARLVRLQRCIIGQHFDEPESEQADVIDEDEAEGYTSEPQDGKKRRPLPAAGTIGALRRFIQDCKPTTFDDPTAMGLQAALRNAASQPATPATLTIALSGSGDLGTMAVGIPVFQYDELDDQCFPKGIHTLLLLGMHDHGFGAVPSPDAFLGEAMLGQLGEPAGVEAVNKRENRLLRVAVQAERVRAFLPKIDADGRAVRAVISPRLSVVSGTEGGSFGLGLQTGREAEARATFHIRDGVAPPPSPGESGAMAAQMSLEFARNGLGREAPAAAPPKNASLVQVLKVLEDGKNSPLGPAWMGPWLGRFEADDRWAKSADGSYTPWSVSGHFEALCNLPYRFFTSRVLGIREPEEVSEELDPTEIGESLHLAMEKLADVLKQHLRPSQEDLEASREAVLTKLRVEAENVLTEAENRLGARDESAMAAFEGQRQRWKSHWGDAGGSWIKPRVQPRAGRQKVLDKRLESAMKALGEYDRSLAKLLSTAPASVDTKEKTRTDNLSAWLLSMVLGKNPKAAKYGKVSLSSEFIDNFHATTNIAGLQRAAVLVREGIAPMTAAYVGEIVAVIPEVSFGAPAEDEDADPEAIRFATAALKLGHYHIPVTGSIDRVLLAKDGDDNGIEILDYKSGANKGGAELERGVHNLTLPQLPVYALVLAELLSIDELGALPKSCPITTLGYDYLRHRTSKGLIPAPIPATPTQTVEWTTELGSLVDRAFAGRFDLVPADASQKSYSFGFQRGEIGLRSVSRFGKLPGAGDDDDDNDDDNDEIDTDNDPSGDSE